MISSNQNNRTTVERKLPKQKLIRKNRNRSFRHNMSTLVLIKFDSISGELIRWSIVWMDRRRNQTTQKFFCKHMEQESIAFSRGWPILRGKRWYAANDIWHHIRTTSITKRRAVSWSENSMGTIWSLLLGHMNTTLTGEINPSIKKSIESIYWVKEWSLKRII